MKTHRHIIGIDSERMKATAATCRRVIAGLAIACCSPARPCVPLAAHRVPSLAGPLPRRELPRACTMMGWPSRGRTGGPTPRPPSARRPSSSRISRGLERARSCAQEARALRRLGERLPGGAPPAPELPAGHRVSRRNLRRHGQAHRRGADAGAPPVARPHTGGAARAGHGGRCVGVLSRSPRRTASPGVNRSSWCAASRPSSARRIGGPESSHQRKANERYHPPIRIATAGVGTGDSGFEARRWPSRRDANDRCGRRTEPASAAHPHQQGGRFGNGKDTVHRRASLRHALASGSCSVGQSGRAMEQEPSRHRPDAGCPVADAPSHAQLRHHACRHLRRRHGHRRDARAVRDHPPGNIARLPRRTPRPPQRRTKSSWRCIRHSR